MNAIAPWAQPHMATIGATITKDKPWAGSGYYYPALVTNNDLSADKVYNLVKAMDLSHGDFKGTAPGVDGIPAIRVTKPNSPSPKRTAPDACVDA